MATRKPSLPAASKDQGVLATNVYDPTTSTWYGPSYVENGQPPAEFADALHRSVWDVRANWPTKEAAEAVGLAWPDEPKDGAGDGDA